MARKSRKNGKSLPRAKATEAPKAPPPVNAMEVLKERMQQANKASLIEALNQVKNTRPEEWKDVDRVKDLAKKLAGSLNLKISEERLDQFAKAYKDATKGDQPQDPDQILQKYGQGKVDPQSMDEIKKFLK